MVPELSSSYKWSAGAVAGRNSKVPIYILAEDRLMVIVNVLKITLINLLCMSGLVS